VFFLHAPDFLGYESAFAMVPEHRALVETALRVKKAGNELMRVVGGREIHPINVRVGGFYRAPRRDELAPIAAELRACIEPMREAVRAVGALPCPDFEGDYEFVALTHPDEYAIERGRLRSGSGLDIDPHDYDEHFVEEHVEHSTALHSRMRDGRTYMVGSLARWALGSDKLPADVREAAAEGGVGPVCRNPFKSIVVRAAEVLFALGEAVRIIDAYEPPDPPFVPVPPRAGVGFGWSEAPRGLCYHRYRIDDDGAILDAQIVPPTSQNQRQIEHDLHEYVRRAIDLPDDELTRQCEQAIRNYDPCISCSTHFLTLDVDRG
jgi:coenzyme F420-reducing hydrogenase alpha subunit